MSTVNEYGEIVEDTTYDPFGNIVSVDQPPPPEPTYNDPQTNVDEYGNIVPYDQPMRYDAYYNDSQTTVDEYGNVVPIDQPTAYEPTYNDPQTKVDEYGNIVSIDNDDDDFLVPDMGLPFASDNPAILTQSPIMQRGSLAYLRSPINQSAMEMLNVGATYNDGPDQMVKDASWVRLSFAIPRTKDKDDRNVDTLDALDYSSRRFSSATLKFTDSSIGGNTCINPPAQFTRYTDIRDPGLRKEEDPGVSYPTSKDGLGMGRYYSEAIDDNNQIIHLRFGVPQFNSMTQFFTGFYDGKLARLARQGRFDDPSFFIRVGQVLGVAVAPLFLIPMLAVMAGSAVRMLMNAPSSKFYTLKPTMPLYWTAVQTMVNQIGVNQGLVFPAALSSDSKKALQKILGKDERIGEADSQLSLLANAMPEFNSDGQINVFAVANKSKRLQNRFEANLSRALEKLKNGHSTKEYGEAIRRALTDSSILQKPAGSKEPRTVSLEGLLTRYFNDVKEWSGIGAGDSSKVAELESGMHSEAKGATKDENGFLIPKKQSDSFFDYFVANLAEGGDFASFRVDYTGPVTESFSNSASESSLAGTINNHSRENRNKIITLSGGHTGIGFIDAALSAVQKVAAGAASVLNIEGVAALAGSAFVDIPKNWESSVATLPRSTYTISLVSPYGNPVSQMFNIYVPLCMLLAGALPLSTGKQSYTSPFLCELHDRGRAIVKLGIIDSLSITRGTGNLGFDNQGRAMAIDVSFSVLDFSSIVSMPINPSLISGAYGKFFDHENAFSDYLLAISANKLGDQIYAWPQLKRNFKRVAADFKSFFSTAQFADKVANLPGVRSLGMFFTGVDKK